MHNFHRDPLCLCSVEGEDERSLGILSLLLIAANQNAREVTDGTLGSLRGYVSHVSVNKYVVFAPLTHKIMVEKCKYRCNIQT